MLVNLNLRPQNEGRFSGPKTAPFPLLFLGNDREWGQKYNSNIFPSAAHAPIARFGVVVVVAVRSAEENCHRPKWKAKTLDRKKTFIVLSRSAFLNPQLFLEPRLLIQPQTILVGVQSSLKISSLQSTNLCLVSLVTLGNLCQDAILGEKAFSPLMSVGAQ